MNWYEDQFDKFEVRSRNDVREFNKWIKENPNRSFDEIGKWGWNIVRSWMHWYGVYTLPTTELNDYIFKKFFPEDEWPDDRMDNEVVEVAAGYGMLGRMLGIKMTDSYVQQKNKLVSQYYDLNGQPRINYPPDVIRMEANKVPVVYHPHTIIGSYVTWGNKNFDVCMLLGASEHGPIVEDLYEKVNRIILIGNTTIQAHVTYPIRVYPYVEYKDIPGLITRSKPSENRIWVWYNDKINF